MQIRVGDIINRFLENLTIFQGVDQRFLYLVRPDG